MMGDRVKYLAVDSGGAWGVIAEAPVSEKPVRRVWRVAFNMNQADAVTLADILTKREAFVPGGARG